MAWYEDWFDSNAYEVVYRQRDLEDASRVIDLIEAAARPEPESRILDVACGRGRHARLLARRGFRVCGVDLSPNAIRAARQRAGDEGVDVDFLVADMRDLPFESVYDGVVNLFTSFGYFETDAEHQQAIDNMARALWPQGWLLQDFLNAAHVLEHLVPEDEREVEANGTGRITLRQKRWVEGEPGARRLIKAIELHCVDHPAGEPDAYQYSESVRLFEQEDFQRMYAAAGLRLERVYGDYDGSAFGPGSPRLILLAQRPL